jgi:hypothetical protein
LSRGKRERRGEGKEGKKERRKRIEAVGKRQDG